MRSTPNGRRGVRFGLSVVGLLAACGNPTEVPVDPGGGDPPAPTVVPPHTHRAEDLTSGTLLDARLSGNVALLSAPTLSFAGALGWGDGPLLPASSDIEQGGVTPTTDFAELPNVFTEPQTVSHRVMTAQITGVPLPGSGTVGMRFDRDRDTEQSPLGISWSLSGAERWAIGLDEGANDHPDFVLLYNTGIGDIFRVADGAHFQMGNGTGPTPKEHLLFLNDRPGSGNQNVLNMQTYGDVDRYIRAMDAVTGGIPFAVGVNGSVGVGGDRPTDDGLMLDVRGDARAVSWRTYSDATLKTDIAPVDDVLDRMAELEAVRFRWKESGQTDIGVLAQEVERLFPELVREQDGLRTVNYDGLTALLLDGLGEMAGRIDALEAAVHHP